MMNNISIIDAPRLDILTQVCPGLGVVDAKAEGLVITHQFNIDAPRLDILRFGVFYPHTRIISGFLRFLNLLGF